jgi:hypothetical protein
MRNFAASKSRNHDYMFLADNLFGDFDLRESTTSVAST